ncbi:MAG: phosphoribosylglycinamide formyltransferase [Bacteroidia bacterium]|nr:phosphoribosylglycinamide formyltransferase [Bacteroidia bacterium]NNF31419.1 phosphoribosylglycinamide formyltransferase [Flavobacteriaceae bacterium]NNJ80907.1 phosphoribosylglycinamide formyltransferase [Flavobacteriaceae bacterium]NNK53998.1 phosphoribosylglycinamide formyltransferase [Flavobacteriaceae bacterium]NNM07575.1 phosphoribosylglycinamide formyltransferase [Flavobacteriaceae bacterium]
MKKRIAIFASGSGTNTQNIIQHFKSSSIGEVVLVLSNKRHAKVLERAENEDIKSLYFHKEDLYDRDGVLKILKEARIDLIVLAGFLIMFPKHILKEFPNKVINIHPALLPKYGGKGMYGKYVHEAIVANKEKESGITIHYVNEAYDEGAIIFQAATGITEEDTPNSVAEKVHALEYEHFPIVIETLLTSEDDG